MEYLKKVITKKIKMSGLALVSDTNRVEKLTDESYATLRRLEYSRGDLTIYINIDYRVEDGQIIGASGMISRGGIGSAVNLYEITKPIGDKSIELGINWFASGTQDVEITKDFIEVLEVATKAVSQVNNYLKLEGANGEL